MIVAYVPDLMDRSKVPGARFVATPSQLPGGAGTTVVVDLSRPGVIEVLPELVESGARVIGFGSHVDGATLDAARATGAEVFARSAFFSRVGELLA